MTGRACGRRSLYMNDYTRKWLPLTQDKLDKMWPSAVATLTNGVYGWEHMDPTVSAALLHIRTSAFPRVNTSSVRPRHPRLAPLTRPQLMGKTMNLSRRVRDSVDAALSKYDLLITPTMVRLPARIDNAHAAMTPLDKMGYAAGVGLNTCPYSLVSRRGSSGSDSAVFSVNLSFCPRSPISPSSPQRLPASAPVSSCVGSSTPVQRLTVH